MAPLVAVAPVMVVAPLVVVLTGPGVRLVVVTGPGARLVVVTGNAHWPLNHCTQVLVSANAVFVQLFQYA